MEKLRQFGLKVLNWLNNVFGATVNFLDLIFTWVPWFNKKFTNLRNWIESTRQKLLAAKSKLNGKKDEQK